MLLDLCKQSGIRIINGRFETDVIEIINHGKYVLVHFLLSLFNKIFEIGYFPTGWSEGYIVPPHEKGSTTDVNSYRGITLLTTLGKLFTRILNNLLTEWAEKHSVYIEAQAGFRSNMGTIDNLFYFTWYYVAYVKQRETAILLFH